MANLTPQVTAVGGTTLTAVTPTATVGDTVPLGCKVRVENGSGAGITVTVVTPGNDQYGLARPDITKSVAAGAAALFGPFPFDLGDPANSNLVTIICSSISSVTLEVVSV